jgi:hypothetical protein
MVGYDSYDSRLTFRGYSTIEAGVGTAITF